MATRVSCPFEEMIISLFIEQTPAERNGRQARRAHEGRHGTQGGKQRERQQQHGLRKTSW
jgi:hypothetical protein